MSVDCEEFQGAYDLLVDAREGRDEVDPGWVESLEEHGRTCPDCRQESAAHDRLARTVLRDLARTVLHDLEPDDDDDDDDAPQDG